MMPDGPGGPRIGTRCGRNRTEHNSDARGKDQNFTHHLAPFVVPPALLVAEITRERQPGFAVSQLQMNALGTKPTMLPLQWVRKASGRWSTISRPGVFEHRAPLHFGSSPRHTRSISSALR